MPGKHGWVEQAGEKRVDLTLSNAWKTVRKMPVQEQKELFALLWSSPKTERDWLTKEAVKQYLQTGTVKGVKTLKES